MLNIKRAVMKYYTVTFLLHSIVIYRQKQAGYFNITYFMSAADEICRYRYVAPLKVYINNLQWIR